MERGVLGPVRGMLTRSEHEDVRLAVLIPHEDDPNRFAMRWAEGHRPESVRSYNREIDKTLAGLAYRRGDVIESPNVREDPRFEPHPKETRPFATLVAMPLRIDEEIVGAFSVVSTADAAFDPADVWFIKIIGAVLDLLLATEHDITRWEAEAEAQGRHPRTAAAEETPREDPDGG